MSNIVAISNMCVAIKLVRIQPTCSYNVKGHEIIKQNPVTVPKWGLPAGIQEYSKMVILA